MTSLEASLKTYHLQIQQEVDGPLDLEEELRLPGFHHQSYWLKNQLLEVVPSDENLKLTAWK